MPLPDSRILNSGLQQHTLAAGATHQRTWTETFQTKLLATASSYKLNATNADVANDQRLDQENTVEETSVFLEATYIPFQQTSLTVGYEFVETGITDLQQIDNPLFFREEKNVMRRNSGFAVLEYLSQDKNTNINIGVRANHYNKFNTTFVEPRLSLSHRFLDHFTIELLGELKSQNTSQVIDLQKDFLGVENRRWQLSDPNRIPLLQSQQSSIGLSFHKNRLLINIEPYLKKVDGITAQSQGFQNQFENLSDIGSYTVKGVDMLLNKKFNAVTTWLSYSYADNRYRFDQLQPTVFHNNLDITHTLNAGGNYKWKQFDVALGLNWHTGKPYTAPDRTNPVTDGSINYAFPNAERIKDYVRVDTSVLYSFQISKQVRALAGISFWNLLDRENHVRSYFTLDDDQNVNRINDRALPFTSNAAFRIFF
ncbi:MAG: TonB-dependent receptor, partial [Marinirhabdus sp.]|nr:TonB-dependent receptor [Marinirhabdus sp.]